MKKNILGCITFLIEYGVIVFISMMMDYTDDYTIRFIFLYFMIQIVFKHYSTDSVLIWEEIKLLMLSHICFYFASILLIPVSFISDEYIFENSLITLFMLLFTIVLARYLRLFLRSWLMDNVLVIGTGSAAASLEIVCKANRFSLMNVIGFVDLHDDNLFPDLEQAVVVKGSIYGIKQLPKLLEEQSIDQVVIAVPNISESGLDKLMSFLYDKVQKIKYLPQTNGLVTFDTKVEDFDGLLLVSTVRGEFPIFSMYLKRLIDIVGSFIGCLMVLPIILCVKYVNLKHGDKDPIFFTQNRVGKNGKIFKMFKFRTMVPNAEKILDDLMKDNPAIKAEYELNKKLVDDPRITKAGQFLRSRSLDEFPQMINVLMGEMSLVGPRPYLPREKHDMGIHYCSIIGCKPGITGMWQSHGRNDVGFEDRCKMDDYYFNNWNFWLDITIMVKTVKAVFHRSGAI